MQRILKKELEPGDIGDSNEKYADNHKQGDKKRKVSYNVHPFVDYSIPQSPVRDVSIRLESLSKILNAEVDSNYLSVARDLFSLSFYLGGINMTDLMDMDRKKLYINFLG